MTTRRIIAFAAVLCLLVISIFVALPSHTQASAPDSMQVQTTPDSHNEADLQTFFDEFMAEHTEGYDGLGVIVADREGVLFSAGYGTPTLIASDDVDPAQTVFRGASVGKVFVVTAALQLVEQGRLDLDAQVNDIVEGFALDGGVTVRDLLTHTGAIESGFLGAEVINEADLIPMSEFFQLSPPAITGPTGEYISYSNHGMALAGHVVEVVTGQSFYDYADEHLFGPLAMTRSTFRQPLPPELEAGAAHFEFNDFVIPIRQQLSRPQPMIWGTS